MKMLLFKLSAVSFVLLLTSCAEPSKGVSKTKAATETAQNEEVAVVTDVTTAVKDGIDPNNKFHQAVEAVFCQDYKDNIKECYEAHAHAVKSDFLQKIPLGINKPYDADIDWSQFNKTSDFNYYWSYKCGFQNEKTGAILNYYCPVISTPSSCLNAIANKNTLIDLFNVEYKKYNTFTPQLQQQFILGAQTEFNFDDTDQRTAYWLYHFGLSELMHAEKTFKTTNS